MQNHVIAIGGLETAYMRKLALYLSNRLEGQARVAIVGEPETEEPADGKAVWIGSREFVDRIRKQREQADCIVLSEEESGEESVVFRYQPTEKIYQRIVFLCSRMCAVAVPETENTAQKWIVMTTDSAASQLLAFSLTAAEVLKEKGNVLYLNLTGCAGMEALLQVGQGANLSDLALAVRAGNDVALQAFVRRVESVDCVFPPDNPCVLYELRGEDIARMMTLIQAETQYAYVLVALGNVCCGCELFFDRASAVFHISREGEVFESCTEEWMRFIRLCLEPKKTPVRQIAAPPCRTEETGIHLLYEWREGALGRLAEKVLEEV